MTNNKRTREDLLQTIRRLEERVIQLEELVFEKQSLMQKNELITDIVRFSDDAIFSATTCGTVVSWNKGAEKIYGYTSQEVVGNNISLLTPPDRKDELQEMITRIGSGQRIDHIETVQITREKVPIHVSLTISPILNTTRAVVGVCGIARDITGSKLAEEELKQTVEKLRRAFANTIDIIALTMETRDPYTAGHQTRVSSLARYIGQEMRLSVEAIDHIRMAGSIHDIGKMSIPTEILTKPSRLMDVEKALIMVHPRSGYDIIKKAELPYPIAEIVLQHHERLDGSGYPDGLKGDEILAEAKIIAVADVVEAIASHRPYRPGFGIGMALEEIKKNRGTLYDSDVADACIRLFVEDRFQFPQL